MQEAVVANILNFNKDGFVDMTSKVVNSYLEQGWKLFSVEVNKTKEHWYSRTIEGLTVVFVRETEVLK